MGQLFHALNQKYFSLGLDDEFPALKQIQGEYTYKEEIDGFEPNDPNCMKHDGFLYSDDWYNCLQLMKGLEPQQVHWLQKRRKRLGDLRTTRPYWHSSSQYFHEYFPFHAYQHRDTPDIANEFRGLKSAYKELLQSVSKKFETQIKDQYKESFRVWHIRRSKPYLLETDTPWLDAIPLGQRAYGTALHTLFDIHRAYKLMEMGFSNSDELAYRLILPPAKLNKVLSSMEHKHQVRMYDDEDEGNTSLVHHIHVNFMESINGGQARCDDFQSFLRETDADGDLVKHMNRLYVEAFYARENLNLKKRNIKKSDPGFHTMQAMKFRSVFALTTAYSDYFQILQPQDAFKKKSFYEDQASYISVTQNLIARRNVKIFNFIRGDSSTDQYNRMAQLYDAEEDERFGAAWRLRMRFPIEENDFQGSGVSELSAEDEESLTEFFRANYGGAKQSNEHEFPGIAEEETTVDSEKVISFLEDDYITDDEDE